MSETKNTTWPSFLMRNGISVAVDSPGVEPVCSVIMRSSITLYFADAVAGTACHQVDDTGPCLAFVEDAAPLRLELLPQRIVDGAHPRELLAPLPRARGVDDRARVEPLLARLDR